MCHIVVDSDCEALLRGIAFHVAVNGDNLARVGVFRAKAIAACVNRCGFKLASLEGSNNIKVQRLANGTALFCTVKHADLLNSLRQDVQQILGNKRTVQVDFYKANLFTLRVKVVNHFFCALADGAHGDNYLGGIRGTIVVKWLIVCTNLGIDLIHIVNDNFRECVIMGVACLVDLEEHVIIFAGAFCHWVFRVHGIAAEIINSLPVKHICKILVVPDMDFLNLVGGTESVEEMHYRDTALNSRKMSDCAKIHALLRAV